jgi:Ca2+-binding EF-hand superfamily protein
MKKSVKLNFSGENMTKAVTEAGQKFVEETINKLLNKVDNNISGTNGSKSKSNYRI